MHVILTVCYFGLLGLIIYTTVDVNKNNIDYTAYIVDELKPFNILAGIVLGVGFFPLTIFIVYYWCTKCFGGKDTSDDEDRNEIA